MYNMHKVAENRKCTEWPQTELKHLTVKITLHTLNTYPRGSNFGPFRSTVSRFRDTTCTRWAKIGNAPNDPKLNLSTWQSKVLFIHLILTHEVQIFVRFALRLGVSKIQGRQKSEMHRVTPNWISTLYSQKYLIYTKCLPLRSIFWSISLYDQRFPRYRTFYNSPLTTTLKVPKRTRKKLTKIQKLKFHNSLYNFGRGPS